REPLLEAHSLRQPPAVADRRRPAQLPPIALAGAGLQRRELDVRGRARLWRRSVPGPARDAGGQAFRLGDAPAAGWCQVASALGSVLELPLLLRSALAPPVSARAHVSS